MNMDRLRPPPGCRDLDLWLSGVVNDAIRDAVEAGLRRRDALRIARILGRDENRPTIDGGIPAWFDDATEAAAMAMYAHGTERNLALAQYGIRAFLRAASEHGYRLRPEEQREPLRAALAEALSVLRAINANRHAPTTDKERAAVAELERVILLCGRTLDAPPAGETTSP